MCGLTAALRWDGADALSLAQSMMQRAVHRGPDGLGSRRVHRDGTLDMALAHARLAILGRGEQGAQPFERGAITLVYNGEIYNFQALKDELRSLGHQLSGTGDTEVLAAAWVEWGPACLERLDGMFAFVVWDARQRRLYAARDAFAIKPLHMLRTRGGLAFASEIKQFQAVPDWRPSADGEMLGAFLALGLHDFDPTRTFFTDVIRVEPGTCIEIEPSSGDASVHAVRRFADPARVPGITVHDREEALSLVRETIHASLRDHLVSEVPVGSCASGGTDSSIVVTAATAQLGRGPDLFHARTAVQAMDELPFVQSLARRTGSRVHVVDITPHGLREAFDQVVLAQDEPFSDASVIAQWMLMRRAREQGIPVLLDGQGSDEMFMGYAKYQFHHLQDLMRQGRLLPMALHMLRLLASGEHGGLRLWNKMQRYLPRAMRRAGALPLPAWATAGCPAWEAWRRSTRSADEVARRDVTQWSLPLLLRYEDRNSMAHAVEARVPYVCWRVMRAARSIDPALHVRGGRVKSLLREAFAADLPSEIASRRTRLGFVTAWGAWTGPGGALEAWAWDQAMVGLRHTVEGSGVSSIDPSAVDRFRRTPSGRDLLFRWQVAGIWLHRFRAVPE